MKELKRLSQSRRDFRADYICQNCEHIEKNVSGYDDTYFNVTVVSKMECPKCNKTSLDLDVELHDNTVVPAYKTV